MPTPTPIAGASAAVAEPTQHETGSLPHVPEALPLAQQIEQETKALEQGLIDAGVKTRVPTSLKRPDGKRAAPRAATEDPDDPTAPADTRGAAPNTGAPRSQSTLSAGFSKLARFEKRAARQEQELATKAESIKAEEQRLAAERDAVRRERESWQTEQAAKLEELKLLDADESAWLEGYAKRRGTTPRAVYDKLMRRVLNDGKVPAEDAAAEVKHELEALKANVEADKSDRAKKEAEAKAEADKRRTEYEAQQQIAREKMGFAEYVVKTEATKFPLLSKEKPEEIAEVGYQLAADFFKRTGKPATLDMVASHLEAQLKTEAELTELRALKAAKAGKAAPAAVLTESDDEPEVSARGNGAVTKTAKPETTPTPKTANKLKRADASPGPKSLSNQLSSLRSSQRVAYPRNDEERLDRALGAWK